MHNHDDDLIAELAGGHLTAAESETARAAIASCSRCRAELAAQISARSSVRSLSQPTLNQFESARLHHVISQQAKVPTPWYVRLAPAIGAAAAVVLVAGIGVTIFGPSSDVAQVSDPVSEAAAPAATEPRPAASQNLEDEAAAPAEQGSELLRSSAATGPVDFGDLTEEQLQDLLETLANTAAQDTSGSAFAEALPSPAPECSEDVDGVYLGHASVERAPIELYRTTDNQAVAHASESCEIVAQFP